MKQVTYRYTYNIHMYVYIVKSLTKLIRIRAVRRKRVQNFTNLLDPRLGRDLFVDADNTIE